MKRKVFLKVVVLALAVGLGWPQVAVSKELTVTIGHHLAGDLQQTFGSWPIFTLIGGGILAAALHPADGPLQTHFITPHTHRLDQIGKWAGSSLIIDGAAVATWGIGAIAHNNTLYRTGEALTEALMFTEAATGGLKLLAQRQRPDGGNYSFPSGHAARSFAVATVLQVMHGPAFGIPAYLAAGVISYTRLDSNQHFLTDVVAGAALGSAFGWGVARFHKHHLPPKWAVVPMLGETKGVGFVYVF